MAERWQHACEEQRPDLTNSSDVVAPRLALVPLDRLRKVNPATHRASHHQVEINRWGTCLRAALIVRIQRNHVQLVV
eukprot:761351-Hanusia_phi.AAC.5